jgi:hypothetical protein
MSPGTFGGRSSPAAPFRLAPIVGEILRAFVFSSLPNARPSVDAAVEGVSAWTSAVVSG